MKSLIVLVVLLVSPVLWAESWYYSCGKSLGIENRILIKDASHGLFSAQHIFPARDTTQTIRAAKMDMIGRMDSLNILSGKPESTFSLEGVNLPSYKLYVQATVKPGKQVRALQITYLSQHPLKTTQSKLNCVLVDYRN